MRARRAAWACAMLGSAIDQKLEGGPDVGTQEYRGRSAPGDLSMVGDQLGTAGSARTVSTSKPCLIGPVPSTLHAQVG